jgi:hypothetical protein
MRTLACVRAGPCARGRGRAGPARGAVRRGAGAVRLPAPVRRRCEVCVLCACGRAGHAHARARPHPHPHTPTLTHTLCVRARTTHTTPSLPHTHTHARAPGCRCAPLPAAHRDVQPGAVCGAAPAGHALEPAHGVPARAAGRRLHGASWCVCACVRMCACAPALRACVCPCVFAGASGWNGRPAMGVRAHDTLCAPACALPHAPYTSPCLPPPKHPHMLTPNTHPHPPTHTHTHTRARARGRWARA